MVKDIDSLSSGSSFRSPFTNEDLPAPEGALDQGHFYYSLRNDPTVYTFNEVSGEDLFGRDGFSYLYFQTKRFLLFNSNEPVYIKIFTNYVDLEPIDGDPNILKTYIRVGDHQAKIVDLKIQR